MPTVLILRNFEALMDYVKMLGLILLPRAESETPEDRRHVLSRLFVEATAVSTLMGREDTAASSIDPNIHQWNNKCITDENADGQDLIVVVPIEVAT